MSETVVAIPRRDRVVLAAILREDAAGTPLARMEVVAEDGARFAIPSDQAIARFEGALDGHAGRVEERLAALRASAAAPLPWSGVSARLEPRRVATFDEIAAAAGAADAASRVRVAVALGAAQPWLRREGAGWFVVPHEEAVARIAAAEAARKASKEDEHVRQWWPRRRSEPPPSHAAGGIAALRDYGLRGDAPSAERGRLLAAKLDMPDPDLVLESLDECGLLDPATNPAPCRSGLGDGFPAAALAESAELAASAASPEGREDLTSLHTVSVDDAETVEVDDALSVRRTPDGVEVFVHISDASDAVPAGGALDAAARERATSLYMPDGRVTMLPSDVVARRGSLDRGEVRAAVTGIFVVRPDGTLAASRFVRSLVRVTRRLSYADTVDTSTLAASREDAEALVAAAAALRAARVRGGALVSGLPSMKVRLEDGAPRVERRGQDEPGDLVVAELAVLYNAEAGRLLASRDVAALFRAQEPPRSPEPDPASPLAPVLARRRFAPTHLRVEPARHHGVGCDAYAQATSPLRRYADLVNQRQLLAVLAGAAPPYRPADLETLSNHLSERERTVRRASFDREDHWVARWVRDRGVREFSGVLVRAPRRGLGSVWVDELLRELPLRAPDRWKSPPEGTLANWRVERVLPWRGRIELAPV